MDGWNRLLQLLDQTVGLPNKIRSTVQKKWQSFDQRTGEHVILLEYRIKVKPGIYPPAKPSGSMGTLRELMDVKFVHTEDSSPSPSPRSPEKPKRATTKTALRPRKIRSRLPMPPIKPK